VDTVRADFAAFPSLSAQEAGDAQLLRALLEVFAQLRLKDQLRALVRQSRLLSGANDALVLGVDDSPNAFVPVAHEIERESSRVLVRVRVDRSRVEAWIADGGKVRLLDQLLGVQAFAGATIAVPVCPGMERAAALLVLLGDAFEATTEHRVRRFVELCRPSVDNALHVQAMGDLVIKDDTVECFNRRYFEEFLSEEIARASRFRAPLSLIFFDMDGLKQVNSALGHVMGSRTLYEVSLRVRGKIRRFDKLFRFGGDEFCIVLPETEWHGALEVAERVRDAIASRPFLLDVPGIDEGIRMTASFGIASFPLHARTKADLLARADRAMQKIKEGVKNSVSIAELQGGDAGG
jgi:diguanylate cyclase (GGDEF)-like protein